MAITDVPKKSTIFSVTALLVDLGLIVSSVLLFSLSFSNVIAKNGIGFIGFISLVPVAILVHRSSWIRIWLYGFISGLLTYAVFNFWLLIFHPLAIFIVPLIYATYYLLLFPCLKLADSLFPERGFIVQTIIWLGYEYLRTKGFLGYAYGIIGYTQHQFLPVVQLAALTGIWGVSALVAFPSFLLGNALKNLSLRSFTAFMRKHRLSAAVYGGIFLIVVISGWVSMRDYSQEPTWRVSLIQHDIDPWGNNAAYYEAGLDALKSLSNEALKDNPDIVVWSETAFVPRIDFHLQHRLNREYYRLVRELLDYLAVQEVPFVIGNDHAEGVVQDAAGRIDAARDYNASMLYIRGERQDLYKKVHLVPFTENFPYERIFPWAYRMLREADTHFWEKGDRFTVFDAEGVRFSTPICFEDTFGYLSREFVRGGAQVIVNMTNDSWSGSEVSMRQHMHMSVFRAVENRRTVVRAANGGLTCVIDPDGRVLAELDTFTRAHLTYDVPLFDSVDTIYTRFGDYLARGFLILGVGLLLGGVIRRLRLAKN
ncbi:MAG: apolipoprotein N-acyltransferase [Spirochaetales bacterium]|nr:apolipoprotein N-acyltransferase [Spirochaetales bacterium]